MLVDLTDALEHNSRVMRRNGLVFKVGFALMLAGLIGCVVVGEVIEKGIGGGGKTTRR
ncbi:MAG TPA: hypothetical protein VJQ85_04475 [Gaiellaceae bacterium]|nr:hypothetical protein [Gaiellaceae bacterium]